MRIITLVYQLLFGFVLVLAFMSIGSANTKSKVCSSIEYESPSNKDNTITFIFDGNYKCGQYINGDWWVSAGEKGVVTIVEITPDSLGGFNGMEINPSTFKSHGFDSRIKGYNYKLNVKIPASIPPDTSVVKVVSHMHDKKNKCRPCIKYAAVLTVTVAPVRDSNVLFRPGYFGSRKGAYRFDSKLFNRLIHVPVSCCKNIGFNDFRKISKMYQGVRLDHIYGWVGRDVHPIDNMPDYGAAIATKNAVTVLRFLLSDFDPYNQIHKSALINYLQMSIDLQSMAINGAIWPGNGGHGNGRKLPILFAWHVFQNKDFLEAINKTTFSEDEQVYYSKKAGLSLYGAPCSDKRYWLTTMYGRGPRDCRDPYGYIDGGGNEIGGAYQVCCTAMPWKYTALAVRMLGLEEKWNNYSFLNYVDRWVNIGVWADPDPCAPYNGKASDYLKIYGKNDDNSCIPGHGRYKDMHATLKNAGNYRSALGDEMWDVFRYAIYKEKK